MAEIVKGYKAFNKNMTNRYNTEFIEGEIYYTEGPLKFGNNGNGYHFCQRLEDTLRYFPAMEEEIKIAKVTSYEDYIVRDDEYYGYYDLYAARTISIDKILSHEDIIEEMISANYAAATRFVKSFKLSEEELQRFKSVYASSLDVQRALATIKKVTKMLILKNM